MRPVNGEEMKDGNAFPPFFISTTKPVKAHSRRERNQFKGRDPPHSDRAPLAERDTSPDLGGSSHRADSAWRLSDSSDERVRRA